MQDLDTIHRTIESFRNDMIELQINLCAIPAVSPASGGQGEADKAEVLLEFCRRVGFENIDVIKAPDLDVPSGYRPNIIARSKGESSEKTIWVMTHMDVVPPGETALWRGNPFQAWIEGGRIYGRGVEDNQQDLVASLYAVKAFRDTGIKPKYDVGLALVADEEMGNQKGIDYVLKNTDHFRPQDLIIVPDAGNAEGTMIEVAEKSILWLKFETLGTQAHGSTPEKGVNSFKAASYLVTELDNLYRLFPDLDPIFDPPLSTFEPTKKETNVPNINTIPGDDIFYMDCRILPQHDVGRVLQAVREAANVVEERFKVKIAIEEIQNSPAAPPTPQDAPVVEALQQAIQATYGVSGRPIGIGGGTVAAYFRRAGFAAACWSRNEETAHQPNESCVIDNMVGDAKVFAHVFLQP
jgi:succinyl-diaminopimelate desuccinylase